MLPKYTVSIVDDDESVRNALGGLLRSVGLHVNVFSSAEELLATKFAILSSCVITDVHMPGMCGQDLQVELKKGNSTLPVIVMTAFPDVMLEQRVLAAGAFCFLVKPFDANEMLRCVERALHINLN